MQITTNTTSFLAESFESTDRFGHKHAVAVIKATFDVDSDGECHRAHQQVPFVYADQHYGDPGKTSVIYESDFAPVKPRVDLLLCASAIAPGGTPATAVEVALEGPGVRKTALVTGDRVWTKGAAGFRPSPARPFTFLPLVWDRAFGGEDRSHEDSAQHQSELRNLVGTGFHVNSDGLTISELPLPNVERPDQPIQSWSDRPDPIGFCPVGRGWQPRIKLAGTYDGHWLNETRPFLPEDFDDRYFQAAPADQQLSSVSPGDTFFCRNMNNDGQFVARLPLFDVPMRFCFSDRTESAAVATDTVILMPSLRRVVLLGRASVVLPRKFTGLREIQAGRPQRVAPPKRQKPHFANLADAVADARKGS
jgi:hypothetical protein